MKNYRTELAMAPASCSINLRNSFFTQGSCFADAIGERLAIYKLKTLVNPFGVVYNPESIHQVLAYSIFNEPLPEHTFLQNQEVYLNYNFHSEFSSLKKGELVARLTNAIGSAHYFLKDADWLLLTYGTAWVYHRRETGEIVANCHKLPSAMFSKSLLTCETIASSFRSFYDQLKKLNPQIRIILTVSPVRHIKESLELNNVSKSVLRVACHMIGHQYDDVEYFPAFEIMVDDLRDYRFYKPDMLHPTVEAEDYIWEKFMERYFSAELKDFAEHWKAILSAIQHRPFHPATAVHQQFLRTTLNKLERWKGVVDVSEEIAQIEEQLIQ